MITVEQSRMSKKSPLVTVTSKPQLTKSIRLTPPNNAHNDQGVQHTQAEGDVCYGDAGGSVWKLWSFRFLSNL